MIYNVLACLVVCASAAPQQYINDAGYPVIEILRNDAVMEGPNFQYGFEGANGIVVSARGYEGSAGQSNIEGTYAFPLPDGTFAEVRYIADEGGFRAESPLLPTPPPMP